MAAISTLVAVGSLAVAGGSAIAANKNAKAQVAAQNRALEYQQKQNDLSAARQRRDAIRQARQVRAQAENSAATQGVADSSGSLGIRTEQQINAEIKKTRDTYAQFSILQRQGVITAKDLERAYGVVNTRVAHLS